MADSRFIVHVTGDRPHKVDEWTKVYKTMSAAAGQATRWTTNHRGEAVGDWNADIYEIVLGTPGAGNEYRLIPRMRVP